MKKKGKDTAMPLDDPKWQAEMDAHTLAQAQAIKGDKKRLSAAAAAAKKLIEPKEDELKGLRMAARLYRRDD